MATWLDEYFRKSSGGGATPGGSDGDLQRNAAGALAPVRTAAGTVPTSGMVARYDGTKAVYSDDVVELPSGLAAGDMLYVDASLALKRVPIGNTGQVWTVLNKAAGTLGWADGGSGPGPDPGFDITTLEWSGLWFDPYTTAPWLGSTSAGTSAGRNLIESDVGAKPGTMTLNGVSTAAFNGTSNYLDSVAKVGSFFNTNAYTIVALVRMSSPAAPGSLVYENQAVVTTSPFAHLGLSYSTSGIKAWHADEASARLETPWLACPANTWVMLVMTYNGTTISLSINNGTPVTVAAGNVKLDATTFLRVSCGYFGRFLKSDLRMLGVANKVFTSTELGNVKSAFNSLYLLSL